MYGFTAKQIKMRGLISLVLAVIVLAVSVFAGNGISVSVRSTNDIIYLLLLPLALAWQFYAILLNWKNMLKGFILPIPVVSYCIETCKAMFIMIPKALFWALTHKEA